MMTQEQYQKIMDEIVADWKPEEIIRDEDDIIPFDDTAEIDTDLRNEINDITTSNIAPSNLIKIIDRLLIKNLNNGIVELEKILRLRVETAICSLVLELSHIESLFENGPNKAIMTLSGMYILPRRVFDTIDAMRFTKMLEKELEVNWDSIIKEVIKIRQDKAYKSKKLIWLGSYPELVELFVLLKKQKLVLETGKVGEMSWMEITENFVKGEKNDKPKKITSHNLTSKFSEITSKLSEGKFKAKFCIKRETLVKFKDELINQHKGDAVSNTR
jgi:hypothetical protein